MASIAVLPVLLGLGVDYAIQYQAGAARRGDGRGRRGAVPTIATAALATAVGFLVLLLSPVPMVRGFGLLLVVGIGVAFALALTAGTAALVLAERRRGTRRALASLAARGGGAGGRRARAARPGAGAGGPPAGRVGAAPCCAWAWRGPGGCSPSALRAGVVGWAPGHADRGASPTSSSLVPQDLPPCRDLDALQRATGVAGEVDVVVEGEDLTDPKVVAWMRRLPAPGC